MAVAVQRVSTATAPGPSAGSAPMPPALGRLLPIFSAALRRTALPTSSRVGVMAAYHLGWVDSEGRERRDSGGKFLRGTLALWAATACGGEPSAAMGVATAVEWLHNFTLVHDDIQDGDRERRHRPTVWAVWGEPQAINAGDAMHAVAYRAILGGGGSPRALLRAASAVNDAVLEVIEGQCQDLDLEGRIDASVPTYLRMARAKTGALIGGALQAGALASGAAAGRAALLRRAGSELGVAFQVRDDWLGAWGDSSLTGKACGNDLARRKITYPVVVSRERLQGPARAELRRLYEHPDGDERRILDLLDEAGAQQAVAAELGARRTAARVLAERAGLGETALDEFDSILEFVTERVA